MLLDPIHQSDHWSRGALGAVFGATILARRWSARVAPSCSRRLPGAGGLLVASEQHTLVGFAVAYAIGGGSIGALGFYHVTQAAAARTTPARASQAISRLTIIGAFASPIFLPLTAWLVDQTDWRVALRVDAVAVAVAFLFAAAVVPDHRIPDAPRGRALDAFRAAWLAAANLRAAFGHLHRRTRRGPRPWSAARVQQAIYGVAGAAGAVLVGVALAVTDSWGRPSY